MHPNGYCQQLRSRLAQAKVTYALPRVRAEVGSQTIDVFGYEQGIALLNDLNYRPRPAFQSYTAYSSALIDANTAHYASPKAPEYVLFKYETIDGRYQSLDDAGVLNRLLLNYKPLWEEQGYVLWKKMKLPNAITAQTKLITSLPFDTELALPADGMQWLQLEVKPSRIGRALNFLYKLPRVNLRVTDNLGQRTSYRLIPSMSSKGFLINPYLNTLQQVLRTATGEQTVSITSFSVHVAKRDTIFFKPRISVRLGVVPKPPHSEMDDQARPLATAAGGLRSPDNPGLNRPRSESARLPTILFAQHQVVATERNFMSDIEKIAFLAKDNAREHDPRIPGSKTSKMQWRR